MEGLSIRITRREGDTEQTIDIGSFAPAKPQVINVGAIDTQAEMPLSRESAIEAARACAYARHGDHDYLPQTVDQARTWQPHEWVIDAIRGNAPADIAASLPAELEWSHTLCDGERVNYAKAEAACAALGEGWRLPTRMELESILDLTRHDPAIDTDRFPDTKSGAYWTSTPCAWSSGRAWVVYFDDGYAVSSLRVNNDAFVRAVRSVPAGQ